MKKQLRLTKRYNVDNSISLICRGRVIHRGNKESIENFAIGFFGGKAPCWGRPQFKFSAKKIAEGVEVVEAIAKGVY